MITLRNRLKYLVLTAVFLISTVVLQFAYTHSVSAATRTWVGGTDNNLGTAANWSGGVAPVNGDSIVLGGINSTFTNDISNLSLVGITYNGSGSDPYMQGNSLTLQGNVTDSSATSPGTTQFDLRLDVVLSGNLTVTNSLLTGSTNLQTYALSMDNQNVSCTRLGPLAGTGQLNINAQFLNFSRGSNSFTGPINISGGEVWINQSSLLTTPGAGGITVSGTGSLTLKKTGSPQSKIINEAFTLSGSGYLRSVSLSGEGSDCTYTVSQSYPILLTFAGDFTLQSDFDFRGINHAVVTGAYETNGHTIVPDSTGLFVTDVAQIPITVITASGDQADDAVFAGYKQILSLDGVRGIVGAADGGILKGTGIASVIASTANSIIAPGNSPGKLTALEALQLGGTYQVELLNASSYDRVAVGQDFADSQLGFDEAVEILSGAVLDVSLYDGWSIKQGDQFRIIDNLSATAVAGTFEGLTEGSQFSVTNEGVTVTFNITYVGGDGNDVVITALNTGADPTPPNTGAAQILLANPALLAGLGIVTAGIFIAIAMRRRTA